ncbi:hypothetical protein IKT18_01870 [Candidatus Saccharibacteria bacterium]|nr:hypothetical protein [Candidatus Saccharibacteria bacterium]
MKRNKTGLRKIRISNLRKLKSLFNFVRTSLAIVFIVVVIFLGIGYASITSELSIGGDIGADTQSGLFITNVSVAAMNGASTSQTIKTYYSTLLTNYIYLDADGGSYVIYKIDVKNKNNDAYKLSDVLYDPTSQLGTYTNEYIVPSVLSVADATTLGLSTTNVIDMTGSVPAGGVASFYAKYAYDPSIVSGGTVASAYQTLSNGIVNYQFTQVTGGTVIVVNPDGSQTITTTDQYGNVTVQEIDPNGRVVGYSIDTTNSTSGGLQVLPGNNIDTGVVAFDGNAFSIHIVFKTDLANENGKYVLTALQPNGNNYDGFALYNYNRGYLRIGSYFNRSRSSSTGLLTPNNYAALSSSALTGERTFDVTITYEPTGWNKKPIINASMVGGYQNKYIRGNNAVPNNLSNATITIGGNGIDGQDDMNSLTILEFEVIKL